MSNISKNTLSRVLVHNDINTDDKTCSEFNISLETLGRYKRKGRRFGFGEPPKVVQLPNILLLDIETAPMEIFVWGLYEQRPSPENVIQDWFILSWAAKWLFSKEIMSDVVTPEEAVACDDKRICQSMWNLLETAQIVIAHNGKRFDLRKLNSRFMLNKMLPPSSFQVIDTLKESRKMAAHSSHRLDYLGKLFKNKGKIKTDYALWKRCKVGDPESLLYMDKYCKEDVLLLEEVYLVMRPWIKSHPNISLYIDSNEPVCPACGSKKLHTVEDYVTMASVFPGYRCQKCGHISRGRATQLSLKKRKAMLVSAAK